MWRASITIHNTSRHLGRFRDEREAAVAYDVAARAAFGARSLFATSRCLNSAPLSEETRELLSIEGVRSMRLSSEDGLPEKSTRLYD
jgi:hypothetical protein